MPYFKQLSDAIHTPATTIDYSQFVVEDVGDTFLPSTVTKEDLNFIKPNSPLVSVDAGLMSVAQISNLQNPKENMITCRDKKQSALVISDSGGFSAARDIVDMNRQFIEESFAFSKNYIDIAIAGDIPTFAVEQKTSVIYKTFDDCLQTTVGALEIIKELNQAQQEPVKFLNVIQGATQAEGDIWYEDIKQYDCFGYAISGIQRDSVKYLLIRMLALIAGGKFNRDETWLHFLGVGNLTYAVLLTVLLDALRARFPKLALNISYDSSTAFTMNPKSGDFYTDIDLSDNWTINKDKVVVKDWVDSNKTFPSQSSAVSKIITEGNVVISDPYGKPTMYESGKCLIANHNLGVQMNAIKQANDRLRKGEHENNLAKYLPDTLIKARKVIWDVITEKDPKKAEALLYNHSDNLRALDDVSKVVNKTKAPRAKK
ncbi:hypothetical protein DU002_12480 [Corallincola holothuriorum]|uniref:Uncharacterized protein n=1 Tax=Corallincola holothuriorum TaxID=2282215 RepID=A0A368NHF5_9GAMM|nr:hypothetical protein [Corallincola holothuriorum]RCU49165.1 hypothetical protein DU002_12480 [Corallincola holothuriorum]